MDINCSLCSEAVIGDAAVLSPEPLTKRRPSGVSAREPTHAVWCLKVRRTAPSLTLKSLTVLSSEAESACWLSGSACLSHEGDRSVGASSRSATT